MWDQAWKWMTDHYIYNAFVVFAVTIIIFNPNLIRKLFGKLKIFKFGPLEIQAATSDIDPNMSCPYKRSRDELFAALRETNGKVDKLTSDAEKHFTLLRSVYIDQQKQLFYTKDQPPVERLIGGLKYINEGGNGDTKPEVLAFIDSHEDIYKTVIHLKPELKAKA